MLNLFVCYSWQVKCEAAYFVVVLHSQRCVVITIRGTETPEDLITNGLCKECPLTAEDLAGLIKYFPFFISLTVCIYIFALAGLLGARENFSSYCRWNIMIIFSPYVSSLLI